MRPSWRWETEPTLRFLVAAPLAVAASGLVFELIALASGNTTSPRPVWLLAVGTGLLDAVGLVMVQILLRAHRAGWRDAFGFFGNRWGRHALLAGVLTAPACGVAWAVHQGSSWVLDRWAVPHKSQSVIEALHAGSQPWEQWLLFVFAVGTAPLVEELLFRGILWPLARDRGWRVAGCLLVSLVFALIHWNLAALVPLWILGIFWTWLYERTGDLLAPILSHALFNTANFVWLLVSETGP